MPVRLSYGVFTVPYGVVRCRTMPVRLSCGVLSYAGSFVARGPYEVGFVRDIRKAPLCISSPLLRGHTKKAVALIYITPLRARCIPPPLNRQRFVSSHDNDQQNNLSLKPISSRLDTKYFSKGGFPS